MERVTEEEREIKRERERLRNMEKEKRCRLRFWPPSSTVSYTFPSLK